MAITLTLQPAEAAASDTLIRNNAPDSNYSTDAELAIGELVGFASVNRTLIKFDLSSIPSNAYIVSATLSLWVSGDYSSNARTATAYRLKRDWVESQATWNVYSTGNSWQTAGAGGANDIGDAAGTCAFTATEAVGTEKQFALTTAEVQKLINGTYTNYGWMIMMATESDDGYALDSSSSLTASERPKLVVVYTVPSNVVWYT